MSEPRKPRKPRPSLAARRAGYVAAIVFNLVGYWAVARLVDWPGFSFLTSDFSSVVPALRVGIVAGLVVNTAYLIRDPRWLRALGEVVTSAVSVVVAAIVLRAFPFDFSSPGWETTARVVLIFAIIGSAVSMVVNFVAFFVALFRGEDRAVADAA
jgi:hypothetical protein